jgi:hypothetical protein
LVSVTVIKVDKNFAKTVDILGQIEENSVNSVGSRVSTDNSQEVMFLFRGIKLPI